MNPFVMMVLGGTLLIVCLVIWMATVKAKQQRLEFEVEVCKESIRLLWQEINKHHKETSLRLERLGQ